MAQVEMIDESSPDTRTPITILTGFLGSGKTTLLNHILSENHGLKFAIIENEFGEVGVDDALIQKQKFSLEVEFIEMNNSCIYCTVRGDLIRILKEILVRRCGSASSQYYVILIINLLILLHLFWLHSLPIFFLRSCITNRHHQSNESKNSSSEVHRILFGHSEKQPSSSLHRRGEPSSRFRDSLPSILSIGPFLDHLKHFELISRASIVIKLPLMEVQNCRKAFHSESRSSLKVLRSIDFCDIYTDLLVFDHLSQHSVGRVEIQAVDTGRVVEVDKPVSCCGPGGGLSQVLEVFIIQFH